MKNVLKYIAAFIIIIILFCILLTVTSLIPKEALTKTVKESAIIFNEQTNNYFINICNRPTKFDNWTDSLMINTAYSIDNSTPFYSSMMARKNYIKGKTEIIYPDEAGELKSSSKYESLNQVGDLNDTVNNDTIESFEYARYWHGYLIFLRPMLILFNITQIRHIFLCVFAILAIALLYKLYKNTNLSIAIIFLCGLLMCDYFYIGISLQNTPVFLIAIISSIILLSKDIKDKYMFFLIIGALTSFFDLLSVPILTLSIPLLVYVLLQKNINLKETLLNLFKYCIMWAIGYFGVFAIKWVLVDLLYNRDLIKTSLKQFLYRSNNDSVKFNFDIMYLLNVIYVIIPLFISVITTIILTFIKLIKCKSLKNLKFNYKAILLYLFVSLVVVLWILVMKEHYLQHKFFTYRNNCIIYTCLFLAIYNLYIIDENKKEK